MGKTFILLYDTFAPTKLIERFSLFSVMQMFYFLKLRSIHIIPTLSRDLMWESKKKNFKDMGFINGSVAMVEQFKFFKSILKMECGHDSTFYDLF